MDGKTNEAYWSDYGQFESSVNSLDGKTLVKLRFLGNWFESSVNSLDGKTVVRSLQDRRQFESSENINNGEST